MLAKRLAGAPTEGYAGSVTSTMNDGAQLFSMIKKGENIKGREKELLLGIPADALASPKGNRLEGMTDDEIICGCTTLGRDEIVAEIKRMKLTTVKEVMHVLSWNNEEGCPKCRPSLNYYLGMLWPEEYVDQNESRYTNERYHANIQKDGTYSVVPRIYGGVTSPAELIKIAEVAVKYDVPLVKFTGGQRLDLLGVKKEDLPKMWEERESPRRSAQPLLRAFR